MALADRGESAVKRVQKIVAVMLAVVLLVSSGVPGMASVFAADVKDTEAVTERTTEHAAQKTGKSAEAETAHTAAEGEGKTAGKQTESETQKQTESETQKQTESETQKQTESETQKQTESETAETKKPLPMEPETKEPETQKTEKPKKTVKADGVSITSPDDLAGLIDDLNFREAIYESLERYGWLSGDPDSPPQSIQEILETYRGPIDARNKGIRSIQGIYYLKLATTDSDDYYIDIRDNEITSLMPLTGGNDESFHYGGYLYCKDVDKTGWRSVQIKILNNPIKCFPKPSEIRKLGYLSVESPSRNDVEIVSQDSPELQYYFLRDGVQNALQDPENPGCFSGNLKVGFCQYEFEDEKGTPIPLSLMSISNNTIGMEIEKIDDTYARYSKLQKSTQITISVTLLRFIDFYVKAFSAGDNEDPTVDVFSYPYRMKPTFTIFDHVTIDGDSKGKARVYKKDDVTGKALEGAVFALYREGETEPVRTGLTTHADGYTDIVADLPKGSYYFKETKAPEGYKKSDKTYSFTVGYTSAVDGGLKKLDYVSADKTTVKAEAGEQDTYTTWKMDKPVDFYLKNEKGENIGNGNDVIKNVTLKYSSLDGGAASSVPCKSLEKAEADLNAHIQNNEITGPVSATVEYDEAQIPVVTVEVGNHPVVDVEIEKTWKGVGDAVLPEIEYTLYRTGEDGTAEPVGTCKAVVNGKEISVSDGKVKIAEGLAEEAYTCVYKDLPLYEVKPDGTYTVYKYSVTEAINQKKEKESDCEFIEAGDIGKASEPVEQEDGSKRITIPVTNYRKAKVEITKSASSGPVKTGEMGRQGVEFKLERQKEDKSWELIDSGVTNEEGILCFQWLGWGTYRLTETKTWASYILLKEPIVFTFSKESFSEEDNLNPNKFVYMLVNDYKFDVPKSGGTGTIWFYVSGCLLILIGGLWVYRRRFSINRGKE